MNDMHNFSKARQTAIDQMWEMNKKAASTGAFDRKDNASNQSKAPHIHRKKSDIAISDDDILILGLILILSQDCRDMWLFLALLYVLM